MPIDYAFADAVRDALGGSQGVPCIRPFSNIPLLQIITEDQVPHRHILPNVFNWKHLHVLANCGDLSETLHERLKKDKLLSEEETKRLDTILAEAKPHLTAVPVASFEEEIKAELLADAVKGLVAQGGLKANNVENWTLTVDEGRVQKKNVNYVDLERFVNDIRPKLSVQDSYGVIRTIYYVSGLTFTSDSTVVAKVEGKLSPTAIPVDVTAGFSYTVTNEHDMVIKETVQSDWVVAIEYMELKSVADERDEEGRQPVNSGPFVERLIGPTEQGIESGNRDNDRGIERSNEGGKRGSEQPKKTSEGSDREAEKPPKRSRLG